MMELGQWHRWYKGESPDLGGVGELCAKIFAQFKWLHHKYWVLKNNSEQKLF